MKMTLDEAIKHAEEVANANERLCKTIRRDMQLSDYGKCAEEHRQLAEWLKELKQLRKQTGWIPVSERAPKVADCYAVTRQIGSDLIVDACFFDGTNTWHNDNRINHERNYLTNIVAWMPLPKPYEPQESEEQ